MKISRVLLLLAIVGVAVIIGVNKCGGEKQAQGGPGGPMIAAHVYGLVVKPRPLDDRINTTGTLLANNSVEVRNETAGRLVHLGFEEGRRVNKGDLLIKIYDDDLQAQLRKLQLDAELAATNEGRLRDLLAINGVSQQEYDAAKNQLDGVRADIDVVRAQIARTEVRAPFNGVIGLRSVSEGAYLPAFTVVASLQQLDPMKLEFTLPSRYQERLHVNDTITFTVESSPEPRSGVIYAFEPAVDPGTRSLTARARCANADGALLPGAFAKVEVPLQRILNALMVPSQAIIPEIRGQKVMVSRGGKATPVLVDVGLRNDSTVQVTSGLQPGDTLLTSGIMQVRPGMPVVVNVGN
ncbi:MAG: efflux RND transporter periplasmic adaptor subunit [Flavobacteriales bacterium]|nr:efflux RND transporter periplasmic adaptor subunit [Flavobacteriales bacterium]MCB9193213.1 efflux RND transporter periplasmic adaptor subunit [Flavobacteriales bacterium]